MNVLRVRDVPLEAARGDREINRAAFEDFMRCLGVELVWVKRDSKISKDGSRQCVVCLTHKPRKEFELKYEKAKTVPTCWPCRERHGFGGAHNRGTSMDGVKK